MRLKNLLNKHGIKPDLLSLDQCFMIDNDVLRLMVRQAELSRNDVVLEIGAGTGILTQRIAKYAKKVIAVEKDPKLYNLLSSMLSKQRNVEIIIGNITKCGFFGANKIVSNLPYNIVEWFFKRLNKYQFDLAVLTIPLKFCEKRANRYRNLDIRLVRTIEPASFYPQPKVKSALIKVTAKRRKSAHRPQERSSPHSRLYQ